MARKDRIYAPKKIMSQIIEFKGRVLRINQVNRKQLMMREPERNKYKVVKTFERRMHTLGCTQNEIMVDTENGYFRSRDPLKEWRKLEW